MQRSFRISGCIGERREVEGQLNSRSWSGKAGRSLGLREERQRPFAGLVDLRVGGRDEGSRRACRLRIREKVVGKWKGVFILKVGGSVDRK